MRTSERKILWALFVSIALNVIACAFYVYEWQIGLFQGDLFPFMRLAKDEPEVLTFEKEAPQIKDELLLLRQTPKQELFSLLRDTGELSDGYRKRDCALALLYSVHYLDLGRAFGDRSLQKRGLRLSEKETITLVAGLEDPDYEKLLLFIDQEKWPYTPEGLFRLLQNEAAVRDPSLMLALMRTDEGLAAKTLLMRNTKISQELALELILATSWQEVVKLSKLKLANDELLKKAKRAYIKQLFAKKPELACEALVLADPLYASYICTDDQLFYALLRFKEKPEVVKELASLILQRPRSDRVWQQAKLVLSSFPKQAIKKPQIEKKQIAKKQVVKKKDLFHVVQKGESLWSIAKKYHISVELLQKTNKLSSDSLKPGTKLLIPTN
jgi:LysM repeat protein